MKMSDRMSQADVVVVGNGALGLFLADELIDRQIGSIAVIGPSTREAGASQAAGAMLGCFGEVTTETLRTDASRTRFELGYAAHDRWPEVLRRLEKVSPARTPLQVASDTYMILNTIGGEMDTLNFAAMISALDAYKQPWEEVDPHVIAGYKPRMDSRALRAIRLPGEGAVDARGVLSALEARIRRAGIPILDQTVRRLLSSNGAVTGVELDDGHLIEAGTVVVAAGARSEALVHATFDDMEMIPTFPGLGFAMIARRTSGEHFRDVVRTPNRGFSCGLHVVPAPDGREYYGATNRLVDKVSNCAWLGDMFVLSQYTIYQLDEGSGGYEVEQWLTGNRPVTLDGFPMIGWLPPAGLYLMTGTYRDGFHCAPLLAAHVANELQGIPGIIDPMFTPTRRPVMTRTVEQSIDDLLLHTFAAWFEAGSRGAAQITTGRLSSLWREQATDVYEKLGTDYALGPDLLWYAVQSPAGADRIARYLRGNKGRGDSQTRSVNKASA
jgi:glycine oxidase